MRPSTTACVELVNLDDLAQVFGVARFDNDCHVWTAGLVYGLVFLYCTSVVICTFDE